MTRYRPIQKPVRLGLIGCGGIVQKTHGPCYRAMADAVRVVALADPLAESRDAVGELLGVPPERRYADHRQLLEEGEIDAVTVATPHNLHAEHVIAAAESGEAVICEKPMALSMEEGQAIRAAVRESRVPYALVHNLLFSVHMQAALAELKTGKLGQPFFGRAQSMFNRGARDSVPDMWWTHKAGGGGAILVTAWHEIYSVEALMGSPIRYVEGKVETLLYPMDADDIALLRFEHENGTLSTVNTSWCVPVLAAERGRWCEVHAPEGSLRVHHEREGPLRRYDRAANEWSEVELPALEQVEGLTSSLVGHVGYFAAVFDALASGKDMPVPVEQACHTMAVVEAARRSTRERRAIDVREVGAP